MVTTYGTTWGAVLLSKQYSKVLQWTARGDFFLKKNIKVKGSTEMVGGRRKLEQAEENLRRLGRKTEEADEHRKMLTNMAGGRRKQEEVGDNGNTEWRT